MMKYFGLSIYHDIQPKLCLYYYHLFAGNGSERCASVKLEAQWLQTTEKYFQYQVIVIHLSCK